MEFSIIIGYVAVILALIFGIFFGENGIDFNLMMNFIN